MASGQQLVGDAAERVDVVAWVRFAVLQHFRARVCGRQRAQAARIEHGGVALFFRPLEHARDAEIDHLHFAGVGQKNVRGLEVAMDEAALVRVRERGRHAAHDRQRRANRHAPEIRAPKYLAQRLAGQMLHRQIDDRAGAVEVVHGDDGAVREYLCLARLALQCDQRFRIAAELDVEHLDREIRLAVGRFQLAQVERLVHRAHAADAQTLLEHEAVV